MPARRDTAMTFAKASSKNSASSLATPTARTVEKSAQRLAPPSNAPASAAVRSAARCMLLLGSAEPRPPSPYLAAVRIILRSEPLSKRWLLVPPDERLCHKKEGYRIRRHGCRLIEERNSSERDSSAEVHRIAHDPVGTLHHESTRRVKWRRRPLAHQRKRHHAPQGQGATYGYHHHARHLPSADCRRRRHAGPREEACRKEDENETNEQSGVGNRASEDQHFSQSLSRSRVIRPPTICRWAAPGKRNLPT
jgi:hypothetical protein